MMNSNQKQEGFSKKLIIAEIKNIQERFNDFKSYAMAVISAFAVIIAGLFIFITINISSQMSGLENFKENLRNDINDFIGKNEKQPKIVLENINGEKLDGSTIESTLVDTICGEKNTGICHNKTFSFNIVINNIGRGKTGPLFIKFYSNSILLTHRSSDMKEFSLYSIKNYDSFDPPYLLGKMSLPYQLSFPASEESLGSNLNKMHIKLFYGEGMVEEATFFTNTSFYSYHK